MPVTRHRITSRVLEGNPLGDPIARDLHVYVPPDYGPDVSRRWPAVLAIVGYTGTGGSLFNVDPLSEPLHDKRRSISRPACSGLPSGTAARLGPDPPGGRPRRQPAQAARDLHRLREGKGGGEARLLGSGSSL
jgi:hypothetical protein